MSDIDRFVRRLRVGGVSALVETRTKVIEEAVATIEGLRAERDAAIRRAELAEADAESWRSAIADHKVLMANLAERDEP